MNDNILQLTLDNRDYARFRDLVLERSGLHFPDKKRNDLEIGLSKALAESSLRVENGKYNLDEYYQILRDKNGSAGQLAMSRLVNILTIGETHFFRNEAHFNALSEHALPALIARKRAAAAAIGPHIRPQLRIWSAGCASGEEPYSLAILLDQMLPDIDNWHILILATDINQESLDRARDGIYSNWSFREARAKIARDQYFIWEAALNHYRLCDDMKSRVTFSPHNLIEDNYPTVHNNTASLDLILCRNVTIYFQESDTSSVVDRFYRSLVDGGWLVVGHSEPSLVVYRAFQAVNINGALFYKKTGQPTPWPDDWQWLDGARSNEPHQALINWPVSISSASTTLGDGTMLSPPNVDQMSNLYVPQQSDNNSHTTLPAGSLGEEQTVTATNGASNNHVVDPFELANLLLNKGHVEQAIDELHRKLVISPNFAPAHSLLGRAYANLGHWAEAHRWCDSALQLNVLLAEPYYVLALVYDHDNELKLAISNLKKAIYLERDVPLFHFMLATFYKKSGQTKMAWRACRNAVRILKKWPPTSIVPDTGGASAKHLLDAAQRILGDLEPALQR